MQLRRAASHAAALLTLLLTACTDKNTYAPPPPPNVTVSQPAREQVTGYLEFTGNTQAIKTVQLTARVQGFLEKVYFNDGDRVKAGQLLFLIEPAPYEAKLHQAEAQVAQVKAQLQHAETEFARFTNLRRQNAASETDVTNWQFQRDNARALLEAAEAAAQLARLDLSYTHLVAPFDGRIDRRLQDPGNLVGPGGNAALAQINQLDPIYAYFTINETELLSRIRATGVSPAEAQSRRLPVELGLSGETGYPHQGVLDFTGITLNSTSGTLLMRGVFANPEGSVLPGLFARVRLPKIGSQRVALVVPETALGFDQQGTYVLLVSDQNVVERRPVQLGAQIGRRRVIDEGLQGGEWVVVNGLLRAVPGSKVTPDRQPPAATQAAPEQDSR